MAYDQHQRDAAGISARCGVVTLSDTRTEANDASGAAIRRMLSDAGHSVGQYQIIRDEPTVLKALLIALLARDDLDLVITNGGTGVSRRDATIPVIAELLDTPLPGFGELFRMLSFQQIGGGAMASRAMGGVSRGKLLFALPGSTGACELAMSRLILPELRHLLHDLRK